MLEVLDAAVQRHLKGLRTSLPGTIVAYDAATHRATVRLGVIFPEDQGREVPPLPEVPVMWPGGSSGGLVGSLAAGDGCCVVFFELDPALWLEAGGAQVAPTLRRHGLTPCVIPGLRPDGQALPGASGKTVVYSDNEVLLGDNTATDPVALKTPVEDNLEDLKSALDTFFGVIVPLTTDPVTAGAALTDLQAALALWPADVGATKVKAR